MKRSKAPSVLFANKVPRTDSKDAAPVNHLALYAPKKEVPKETEKENEEPEEMDHQPAKKGKNVRMTETSPPLYFLAYYKSKQKFDDKQGYGVLEVTHGAVYLYSKSCKQIGKATLTRASDDDDKFQIVKIKSKEVYFQEGFNVPIGNKEVSVRSSVTVEEFKNGQVFLKMHEFVKKEKMAAAKGEVVKKRLLLAAARRPAVGKFVIPYKGGGPLIKKNTKPLHNPLAKDALVLFNPKDLFSENKISVVVDPILSAKLRPHQRIGVQFMFDCALGFSKGIQGGLGKSIQAITLLWTLLKQGPNGEPAAKRAVIVAPSSLVGNWVNELKKWLGDRIKAVAIGESTKKGSVRLAQVKSGESDVLVISYDQLRIYAPELQKIPQIELIICDEGHKLKNAEIKTTKAVASLPGKRRVILSGTPIQNNLDEFYAMVNFVNPDVLGDIETFRNTFQIPIEASRIPDADAEDRELGRQRSIELSRLTGQFILRRTAHVNQKYLPPKTEYTVFCKLTDMQKAIYKRLIEEIKSSCPSTTAGALPMITSLKKLCNCPELIHPSSSGGKKKAAAKLKQEARAAAADDEPRRPSRGAAKKVNYADDEQLDGDDGGDDEEEPKKGKGRGKPKANAAGKPKKEGKAKGGDDEEGGGAVPFSLISDLYPPEFNPDVWQPQNSGKMLFLDRLLAEIRATSRDRVVIISNYTQTLEVLSLMCTTRNYPFFRLDGQTPPAKRTKLVDLFNDPARPEFIFLLSSKAGGVGLNLIGGNHLVLFDPDWNPANDAQAMARVWREGQKKNVSIYRTLSTGSIEEKIFQRQITKKALSNSVVEGQTDNAPDFSPKDLKDVSTFTTEDTLCDTHDMLGCRCSKAKKLPPHIRGKVSIGELDSYEHYDSLENIKNNKELQKSGAGGVVTFVMVNSKLPEPPEKKAPRGEEDIVVEHAVSLDDADYDPNSKGNTTNEENEDDNAGPAEESEESESEESEESESDESDD